MKKIFAKDLKNMFVSIFNDKLKISYEKGNPFILKIGSKRYYIFLKNLSPAYFKNSPDITRVQLPYSPHFAKVLKTEIPFIILGYDVENDTFVNWDPTKVKERLNSKSNVSLYSRYSYQTISDKEEYKLKYLSNGDKIFIIQRNKLADYLFNIHDLFSKNRKSDQRKDNFLINEELVIDKLYDINDRDLISKLTPLLKRNRVLEAVKICSKHYGSKYKNMQFKDWFGIVNDLYKKVK